MPVCPCLPVAHALSTEGMLLLLILSQAKVSKPKQSSVSMKWSDELHSAANSTAKPLSENDSNTPLPEFWVCFSTLRRCFSAEVFDHTSISLKSQLPMLSFWVFLTDMLIQSGNNSVCLSPSSWFVGTSWRVLQKWILFFNLTSIGGSSGSLYTGLQFSSHLPSCISCLSQQWARLSINRRERKRPWGHNAPKRGIVSEGTRHSRRASGTKSFRQYRKAKLSSPLVRKSRICTTHMHYTLESSAKISAPVAFDIKNDPEWPQQRTMLRTPRAL